MGVAESLLIYMIIVGAAMGTLAVLIAKIFERSKVKDKKVTMLLGV